MRTRTYELVGIGMGAAGIALVAATLHLMATAVDPVAAQPYAGKVGIHHIPQSMSTFLMYGIAAIAAVAHLVTRRPKWDRVSLAAVEAGFLANTLILVTGSLWARAAWNEWWAVGDPRLSLTLLLWLLFAAYFGVRRAVDDPRRRGRAAAVVCLLAVLDIPFIHFAIQLFGRDQHPTAYGEDAVVFPQTYLVTMLLAALGFALLYGSILLLRLRVHRTEALLDHAADVLDRRRATRPAGGAR